MVHTQINNDQRRDEIIHQFLIVREQTEQICSPLNYEDYVISVTEDTSPPKWHLAHTTWFFERFLLKKFNTKYEFFNLDYEFIFNSYYRKIGSYLSKNKRSVLGHPSVEDIYKYRKVITQRLSELIFNLKYQALEDALKLLEIGINHEQQHQELLLMDIKRNFYENPLRPSYSNVRGEISSFKEETLWHNLPQGLIKIGVESDSSQFAYDNEKDAHPYWIENFWMSSQLVSNDEYAAFIDEGGYDNPVWWLSDGWNLKEKENWTAPLYWEKEGQNWWTFTLSGMAPLDLGSPVVHVNFYEASAFAKWRNARLPSEYEWEAAARWETKYSHFLEDQELIPSSGENDQEFFSQIHGSLWEWTSSSYGPYPRFKSFQYGLDEYNSKFMCNQYVLRGGSCITPKAHYRPTYRNFYYPHMRWQYSGIRLAKDES